LTILYLLWQQVPLFQHHLATVVPPLVLMATMGLLPYPQVKPRRKEDVLFSPALPTSGNVTRKMPKGSLIFIMGNSIAAIAICATVVYFAPTIMHNYQNGQKQTNGANVHMNLQVAGDLNAVTPPGQLVITDAQFLVAQANRSTPPQLVDTSLVRIKSNYLSDDQLIQIAEQSNVRTILFYTGRLYQMQRFSSWVSKSHYFQKVRNYGNGRELWTKIH
jgi:hypothetical protein